MANKHFIFFIFFLCYMVISGCFFDADIENKLDGHWSFSLKRTVEYKNPAEKFDENSVIAQTANKSYLIFDCTEKILRTDIFSGVENIYRYRVVKKDNASIAISVNNSAEILEIMNDGSLLMCPQAIGLKNCLVFIKR